MPNVNNFDVLTDYYGPTELRCIEEGCDFKGFQWEMSEEMQHEHFLTHFNEIQNVTNLEGFTYEITGDVRTQPCRICGENFTQPRRRGRPRLECDSCRG